MGRFTFSKAYSGSRVENALQRNKRRGSQAKGSGGSRQQVAVGLERSEPVWDMNWRQSQQSLERMARYGGRETGESRMSLCP